MKNVALIFDRAISFVLTVAVVVFVAAFVRRSGSPAQQQPPAQPALSYEKGWRKLLSEGNQRTDGKEYAAGQLQDSVQRVEIVEFVDLNAHSASASTLCCKSSRRSLEEGCDVHSFIRRFHRTDSLIPRPECLSVLQRRASFG